MPLEIPAIRILPMSVREPGFSGRSIEDVQAKTFLRDLPKRKGRWRYRATGLNARAGAIVLFQFQARIIASAVFLRDVKFEPGKRAKRGSGGELHFDATSIQNVYPS